MNMSYFAMTMTSNLKPTSTDWDNSTCTSCVVAATSAENACDIFDEIATESKTVPLTKTLFSLMELDYSEDTDDIVARLGGHMSDMDIPVNIDVTLCLYVSPSKYTEHLLKLLDPTQPKPKENTMPNKEKATSTKNTTANKITLKETKVSNENITESPKKEETVKPKKLAYYALPNVNEDGGHSLQVLVVKAADLQGVKNELQLLTSTAELGTLKDLIKLNECSNHDEVRLTLQKFLKAKLNIPKVNDVIEIIIKENGINDPSKYVLRAPKNTALEPALPILSVGNYITIGACLAMVTGGVALLINNK